MIIKVQNEIFNILFNKIEILAFILISFLILQQKSRLNTNVDLILPALDLFEQLKETGNKEKTQTSNNHHILKSVNEFRSTFKYHFSRGSAAERTFLNKADFEHVLNAGLEVDNKHVIMIT